VSIFATALAWRIRKICSLTAFLYWLAFTLIFGIVMIDLWPLMQAYMGIAAIYLDICQCKVFLFFYRTPD